MVDSYIQEGIIQTLRIKDKGITLQILCKTASCEPGATDKKLLLKPLLALTEMCPVTGIY